MEKVRNTQNALRMSFDKIVVKLEDMLSQATEGNLIEIQSHLSVLESKMETLRSHDELLMELLSDSQASTDMLVVEIEKQDEYQTKIELLKRRVSSINVGVSDVCDSKHMEGSTCCEINKRNLPRIEFRKFGGNIRDWLKFWTQFRKIDEDKSLDDADKMEYLRQATVPQSRARELVESFPPVAENYVKVIDTLKSRFGREDLLVELYVRELLALVLHNLKSTPLPLAKLYDSLECHLRSLETLGVTTDVCAAMLCPLVESSLPEELLRLWQRNGQSMNVVKEAEHKSAPSAKDRLAKLLNFLKNEVESEERISLAMTGFGAIPSVKNNRKAGAIPKEITGSTAAGLLANSKSPTHCLFCEGKHKSSACSKAKSMDIEVKRKIVKDKRACFACLELGHSIKYCKSRPKCSICFKAHFSVVCAEGSVDKQSLNEDVAGEASAETNLNSSSAPNVLMQTLRITLRGPNKKKLVRALIDTGSSRSYVKRTTAEELGLTPLRQEVVNHCLFGGSISGDTHHNIYLLRLNDLKKTFFCNFEVLDQNEICDFVPSVRPGIWLKELKEKNIDISDVGSSEPVEVLIGADVAGQLWNGEHLALNSGSLQAWNTKLGWVLMGRLPQMGQDELASQLISMLNCNSSISDLWSLDVLGISDPVEVQTKEELHLAAVKYFNDSVKVNVEGRFEVRMPWVEGHPPLRTNFDLALKRLNLLIKKLEKDCLYNDYNDILNEWMSEGVIEEVPYSDSAPLVGHYLPHRHIIKPGSTTPLRPVFDASARDKSSPSLNCCLEKGINLIQLIPAVLLRFRLKKFAVTGDIRRAFLQISVKDIDRDYLRFLWKDKEGTIRVFRHCRAVFGLVCSPFWLGACIQKHLRMSLETLNGSEDCRSYSRATVEELQNCFYVDNCATSFHNRVEVETFINEATELMKERNFELRQWQMSGESGQEPEVSVLGLLWNKMNDTLQVNTSSLEPMVVDKVTKRVILSLSQRIFDPIGFTCPIMLKPKILLREVWKEKAGWDEEVKVAVKDKFLKWFNDLVYLNDIKIPRWIVGDMEPLHISMHIFADASSEAYAAVIFLRIVTTSGRVLLQLVEARSRVAPVSKITIPRLELLAATIAIRLHASVVKSNLQFSEIEAVFWSDSTTVLAWISREEPWGIFVRNRVTEILKTSKVHQWRYVPTTLNPADLPSRSCTARQLAQSRWWEGPDWLKRAPDEWPTVPQNAYSEEEISKEKLKSVTCTLMALQRETPPWFSYFSQYTKLLRMFAWILRFLRKCRGKSRNKGENTASIEKVMPLAAEELDEAEITLFKMVQKEAFMGEKDPCLSSLSVFKDQDGLLRLETKITLRQDEHAFRQPVVLPSSHSATSSLIKHFHVKACHLGTQGTMNLLREKVWILGGRRTVRKVIAKCVACRRHSAKGFRTETPGLPLDRVRDASVFEVSGVDLAGPLMLRNREKCWIVIFTCAIYRAVHFELTGSLSTDAFLRAFRRFVARCGRPKTMFSDNGLNFVGCVNAFQQLDWNAIKEYSANERIKWYFNPPSAPWWGGWWERMIRMLKDLLKRVLGRALLTYEELETVICDCEAVVNTRPITYLSEDSEEPQPLAPVMFMRNIPHSVSPVNLPECDAIEHKSLNIRIRRCLQLKEDLRKRFRSEYLGLLLQRANQKNKPTRPIKGGEIVLIENENLKRLDWPLAKVTELLPGKDGRVRLVKLRTAVGELLRPIQRVFPLEVLPEESGMSPGAAPDEVEEELQLNEDLNEDKKISDTGDAKVEEEILVHTRKGRLIKKPARYL